MANGPCQQYDDRLSRAASAVHRLIMQWNAHDPISEAYGLGYMGPNERQQERYLRDALAGCGFTPQEYRRALRARLSDKTIYFRCLDVGYFSDDPMGDMMGRNV